MVNTLTLAQLDSLQQLLQAGKVSEFYTALLDNGYDYAGWARGVADGDTIAGLAALDFLTDSALVGGCGPQCAALSPEGIQKIKQEMAQAYLDTLTAIAKDEGGVVRRDITAKEVWNFHEKVFIDNGLSIANWTLNTPFTIIQSVEGGAGLERFWEKIRGTAGDGLDAIWENTLVFARMGLYATNGPMADQAQDWLSLVGIDGTFVSGFLGVLAGVTDLFGGVDKDVLLSRAMVEIVLDHLTPSSDEQDVQITSIVGLVNNTGTARAYIDGIRALFLGAAADSSSTDDLSAIMSGVAGVMADSGIARSVGIESLAELSNSQLQAAAASSIAYRYALRELNPFVVIGAPSLYDAHNQDGSLNLYDPATGEGALTPEWLQARAEMLAWKIQFDARDIAYDQTFNMAGGLFPAPVDGDHVYQDIASGLTLDIDGINPTTLASHYIRFGDATANTLAGDSQSDRLFGGAGNDTLNSDDGDDLLQGGKDDDELNGGAGKDSLDGGAGRDVMAGGDGFDSYWSDSADTLTDSDGLGTVKLVDTTLIGGTRKASDPENIYKSRDGQFTYELNGEVLTINGGLTITDFSNGDLGIRLEIEDEPDEPPQHDPSRAVVRRDPLAIDLDGSGAVETTALATSTTFFDIDSDGVAERVGWIAAQDGLLVNDVNGNAAIDDVSELFGGAGVNGFDALRAAGDGNHDGVIDQNDAIYSQLRVWRDANQDGLSQDGELQSLTALGIDAIKLDHVVVDKDSNGNRVIAEGAIIRNGVEAYAAAFDLQLDNRITKDLGSHTLNQSVLQDLLQRGIQLPVLRGFGSVKDLQTVYAQRDTTMALVQSLTQSGAEAVYKNFEKVLADWSGLTALREQAGLAVTEPLSITEKLWVLESFSGASQFKGVIEQQFSEGKHPVVGDINSDYLNERFQALSLHFANRFLVQSVLSEAFSGTLYSLTSNKLMVTDAAKLQASLVAYAKQAGSKDDAALLAQVYSEFRTELHLDESVIAAQLEGYERATVFHDLLTGAIQDVGIWQSNYAGSEGNTYAIGTASADHLSGNGGDDVLEGRAGSDTLSGGDGNDQLDGGEGTDQLSGGNGDDTLRGGVGANDRLSGDAGNDTYLFGLGDGNTTINNYDVGAGRHDVLQFLQGINPADVRATRNSNDLLLTVQSTGEVVTVTNYFSGDGAGGYALDAIAFADGTAWTIDVVKTLVQQGSADADRLYGYAGDDVINGLGGNDSVYGSTGNDVLSGGDGNDQLSGDDGNDSLAGGAGTDTLTGGAGNDQLLGGADADHLDGGIGDDQLDGGAGNDQLGGGFGNDTYVFGRGSGNDRIQDWDATVGNTDVIALGAGIAESDVRLARDANNQLVLAINDSTDTLTISGFFSAADAGVGAIEQIRFADGTLWDLARIKAEVQRVSAGSDYLVGFGSEDDHFAAGDGNDQLYGRDGNDQLEGEAGNDQLYGEVGNDTLNGGVGADTLSGGEGDDRLFGGDDADHLDGGAGDDQLSGDAGADKVLGGDGADRLDGGADADTLEGGAGDDRLLGDAGADRLSGGEGADRLAGGTGDDYLEGGAGDDRYDFVRGDGRDVIADRQGQTTVVIYDLTIAELYFRRDGSSLVARFGSSPDDEIRLTDFFDPNTGLANSGLRLDSGNGQVWEITPAALDAEVLKATVAGDVIHGNALGNSIDGQDGDDVVYGEGGADSLTGGSGHDRLYGDEGDDQLQGGQGDDQLLGGTGNDQLQGDAGDDQLDGGAGQDRLAGGDGNDRYVVDNVLDAVIETADAGSDRILSSVSYTLPQQVEVLELIGTAAIDATGNAQHNELLGNDNQNRLDGLGGDDVLQGHAGNDTLLGGDGNDLLDGGTGSDQLEGGSGDDVYQVDSAQDVVFERAGEGFDSVQASSDYTLSAQLETLVLVDGSSARVGVGNEGDNTVIGNALGNWLDGAAGADTLIGGLGDDTYGVDQAGDQVVEAVGEGRDTVESRIDYVLGANLENLTLLGNANLQGTGNDQNNRLTGNAGNNRLDGGAGDDELRGGAGDDTYLIDAIDDRVYENADAGIDTVERSFETKQVLANHVENLLLAGSVITGNGNALDNSIVGNAADNALGGWEGDDLLQGLDGNDALFGGVGNDRLLGGAGQDYLDGGEGIDQLEGGAGDDTYIVDDSGDAVLESSDGGNDAVQTTASYALSAHIETLFLQGDSAINGTGNEQGNYMAGNGAANAIDGRGGDDTLVSGGGDDTLIGGSGDDKYVITAASGSVLIDNRDGGFDGVFFAGSVTRERITFLREGDDLLIVVDGSQVPAARVLNHFLGGDFAIGYVQPAGGSLLDAAAINALVLGDTGGGEGGETGGDTGGDTGGETGGNTGTIDPSQFDSVVNGTAAGEQLLGTNGSNLLRAGAGDDTVFAFAGADYLQGDDGADQLYGGNGSFSGSGDDTLEGGAGDDMLVGEDGNDVLNGGAGDDVYFGNDQSGSDLITTGGGSDGIYLQGVSRDRITFLRDGDDLLVRIDGDEALQQRVLNHFLGGDSALAWVQTAGGSLLDTAAINALVVDAGGDTGETGGDTGDETGGDTGGETGGETGGDTDTVDPSQFDSVIDGTSAGEQLLGSNRTNLLRAGAGDDTVFAFAGNDYLQGDDGADQLYGGNGSFSGSGDDTLEGGAGDDMLVGEDGNDVLNGGAGDDVYFGNDQSGSDLITTGGGSDGLYLQGVSRDRITFLRDGDDLLVRIDGDEALQQRVLNHFLGGDSALAWVQPDDGGPMLDATDIAGLLVVQRAPQPASFAANPFEQTARRAQAASTLAAFSAPMSDQTLHGVAITLDEIDIGHATPIAIDAPGVPTPVKDRYQTPPIMPPAAPEEALTGTLPLPSIPAAPRPLPGIDWEALLGTPLGAPLDESPDHASAPGGFFPESPRAAAFRDRRDAIEARLGIVIGEPDPHGQGHQLDRLIDAMARFSGTALGERLEDRHEHRITPIILAPADH